MIGVLGGMGPAATVDFMAKLLQLTPATCDQEHVPVVVANLPQIPDRSRHILGGGADPLPALLDGMDLLNRAGSGLNLITCNTAHHWHEPLARRSRAPLLHIAEASLAALPPHGTAPVALFATRGTLASGFYQRIAAAQGRLLRLPEPAVQPRIDACIQAVKAGDLAAGSAHLARALAAMREQGLAAVILACTELPIAAAPLPPPGLQLIDSSLELARQALLQAGRQGWLRSAAVQPISTRPAQDLPV
ncbi:MAG: aspartate/glutamate racemase family protein [Burkholderiaceae bacterium]|nr:aspartate/glutamate racemase family protein [Burkholderiaceae bacterium]